MTLHKDKVEQNEMKREKLKHMFEMHVHILKTHIC